MALSTTFRVVTGAAMSGSEDENKRIGASPLILDFPLFHFSTSTVKLFFIKLK